MLAGDRPRLNLFKQFVRCRRKNMQSEQAECPYSDLNHCEDEEGRIYCDACHDAKMPEWEGVVEEP